MTLEKRSAAMLCYALVRIMGKKVRVVLDVTELGRAGGHKRAANMTAAERSEGARKASVARWAKAKKKKGAKE
jgi:hypothetical protein